MVPFLKQVADHYYRHGGFDGRVFIFPNRRSMVFFRKYVNDFFYVDSEFGMPMPEPDMCTMNDFFARVTGKESSDRITLLVTLYECYRSIAPDPKDLDDFLTWGQAILSDFDEVDKYKVDPGRLFTNVADLRSIQDDLSWADEKQKAAIEKLAAHFSADGWKIRGGTKSNFLATWHLLLPLYRSFRSRLLSEGLAYEGMAYREFAERLETESAVDMVAPEFRGAEHYVFVGLNALNTCEREVMNRMRDAGLAEFCWDYCGPMVTDPANDSSFFLSRYVKEYPNAFEVKGGGNPDVKVIAVPSATGQMELLDDVISDLRAKDGDAGSWLDYAVVLPDEGMLSGVLNNIPDSVDKVNVTMGYPLASSEMFSFVKMLLAAQMHIRRSGRSTFFYYRQAYDLMSCSVLKTVMSDEDAAIVKAIRKAAKPYIPIEDFASSTLLARIFTPVVSDMTVPSSGQITGLADYLLGLICEVVDRLGDKDDLLLECAHKCYVTINRLKGMELPVLPQTFAKLFSQLGGGVTVPYEGEPLGGLQVMGPLETRALDFRHLIILNSSEGVFPRRNVADTFIPLELRLGFDLPTYKYQDAVWAYYFYRMISRAQTVTMLYDSRTEGLTSGEESRYVKQLRYLYPRYCNLSEAVASAPIRTDMGSGAVAKTKEMIAKIRSKVLSASVLQKYNECPLRFYYYVVEDLYADNEVKDTLDASMLGTVCHDTLQALYCSREAMLDNSDFDKLSSRSWEDTPHMDVITAEYLQSWLAPEAEPILKAKIYSLIRHKLRTFEVSGQSLIDARLAMQYVRKVVQRDIELIKAHGPLTILGLEKEYPEVEIVPGFRFKGFIDRLDSFADGTVRIVDYKTGSDKPEVLSLPDGRNVFSKHENKAALQFYIYDRFVASDDAFKGKIRYNSMYAMGDIFRHGITAYPENADFVEDMDARMSSLMEEICNEAVPFLRTSNVSQTCKFCDYCSLCGMKSAE